MPSVPNDGESYPPDFDEHAIALCRSVRAFTMTSNERVIALRDSVDYVVRHGVPGDVVECGVWKGGSMMAVAKTLIDRRAATRRLHLFDTFDGMSEPNAVDIDFRGESAAIRLSKERESQSTSLVWAKSSLQEVKDNIYSTGYDRDLLRFIPGKVEDTVPVAAPEEISVLRLDTDWYESTYHELVHLYPRLSLGGVLIVDDYGHWSGARRAVDQWIYESGARILLNRIDYTGRIGIKIDP
jgi:O-methyltransferase